MCRFFNRDGTFVTVKHSKVTDDCMVGFSIYAADSAVRSLDTRSDETALALMFTESEADKECVCHDLETLVDASHEGFASIVGKPGFSSGYFESSVQIAGFPVITVHRRERDAAMFSAEDLSDVEALIPG